ncbi:MAG: ABC transporter permease subunit, partial [Bifidobacteriaceae bacterium]|nr:ABC transporter permease subunit [Bifidobacteriaceae bacterium]
MLAGLAALARVGIDPGAMLASGANASNFLRRVGALEFPRFGELLYQTALTLAIVLLGTLLAAAISVPVAFLAARNTSPGRGWQAAGRFAGVLARAMPDVVLAMALALIFPLGALPGIVAIGLHSVGMISRLFADAVEQIDEGPRLAVRAAGAGPVQQLAAGVAPQVMPSWLATTLHRADINLRGSVVLGYVGVPGLGMEMRNAFAALNYSRGLAVAVVIFGLCLAMEALSSAVRRRMLGAEPPARHASRRQSAARATRARSAGRQLARAAAERWRTASFSAPEAPDAPVSGKDATQAFELRPPNQLAESLESRATGKDPAQAFELESPRQPVTGGPAATEGLAGPSAEAGASGLEAYLRRPWDGRRWRRLLGWAAAAGALAAALAVARVRVSGLVEAWAQAPGLLAAFWPPTAGAYGMARLAGALAETLAVALAAALLSFGASLAIGALAARNVAPAAWVRAGARGLLVTIRGVPELVAAIVLIVITGLGAPAGTLALAFCHIGLLGKLMADSFEELPLGPQRALAACGATRWQMFAAGVLAPGRRALTGHALYVLDTNIRAATLLGIVGGGGIGYY